MTDLDRVRAILDAATPGRWAPPDGLDEYQPDEAADIEAIDVDGDDGYPFVVADDLTPADARAIVLARNLLPAALDVVEAARATSDELDELLDPENAPAVHGLWHPARRAMGEKSVELIDDDGCSLWVDPWEVAALVNGAVRYRAALDAFHAKMKETL